MSHCICSHGLSTMSSVGSINIVFEAKGFAFVTPDDGGQDVFVHVKDNPDLCCASQGDSCTFDEEWDYQRGRYRGTNCTISKSGGGEYQYTNDGDDRWAEWSSQSQRRRWRREVKKKAVDDSYTSGVDSCDAGCKEPGPTLAPMPKQIPSPTSEPIPVPTPVPARTPAPCPGDSLANCIGQCSGDKFAGCIASCQGNCPDVPDAQKGFSVSAFEENANEFAMGVLGGFIPQTPLGQDDPIECFARLSNCFLCTQGVTHWCINQEHQKRGAAPTHWDHPPHKFTNKSRFNCVRPTSLQTKKGTLPWQSQIENTYANTDTDTLTKQHTNVQNVFVETMYLNGTHMRTCTCPTKCMMQTQTTCKPQKPIPQMNPVTIAIRITNV